MPKILKIKKHINKLSLIFILSLVILGFITHFLFIWHPAEVVFDEVHYGKYSSGYLSGKYFFSGHPPLGVELIAFGGWLGGYKPHLDFLNIGEKFSDNSFISLRLMPALAGALIPLAVYLFLVTLGVSSFSAFITGILLIFENALLVQSRLILIDPFMILFGFLGLACFFASRSRKYKWFYLGLGGILFGMSAAVKWTGLSFILITGLITIFDLLKILFRKYFREFIVTGFKVLFCVLILSFLVYFLTFYIHFKLLPKSGPGDAFMSQEFLQGKANIFEKFYELNRTSYYSNILIKATHPYSSNFYSWPFMSRPIFYWVNGNARIYLLGNPITWWLSTIAVILAIILFLIKKLFRDRIFSVLLLGYFLNLLPFIMIQRLTFLYHYLPSLIFAISIMAYLISKNRNYKTIFIILLIFSVGAFFYFAPLSYGFNFSPQQYKERIWIDSWE